MLVRRGTSLLEKRLCPLGVYQVGRQEVQKHVDREGAGCPRGGTSVGGTVKGGFLEPEAKSWAVDGWWGWIEEEEAEECLAGC